MSKEASPDDLPTIIAAPDGSRAVELLGLSGMQRVPNRDAYGYYFFVRGDPDSEPTRLGVVFSGTTFAVSPEAYGLPTLTDRDSTFVMFSKVAIADYLSEEGSSIASVGPGEPAPQIEAFSGKFDEWGARPPATDSEMERFVRAHLAWAWLFGHEVVVFGPPDLVRLGQSHDRLLRVIDLGDGVDWEILDTTDNTVTVRANKDFNRQVHRNGPEHVAGADLRPEPEQPQTEHPDEPEKAEMLVPSGHPVFIDEARLGDLRTLRNDRFDLRKLIALCEELNVCYRSQCWHAVGALTRAVLDHVPPIFGAKTFTEVANNYNGGRSFKKQMEHLQNSARNIADQHLHGQIRKSESLPNATQVNFSNDLDVLLAEVARVLGPTEDER